MWADAVHESQDLERLQFWRFSFTPSYAREAIFANLRQLLADLEITSYTIYETLGNYDLLLRAWVPLKVAPDDLELAFEDALSNQRLWGIGYTLCHTVSHPDGTERQAQNEEDGAEARHWPALNDPVIAEVSEFNRAQLSGELIPRSEAIEELLGHGVLKAVPTDLRGVRFYVVFDHPHEHFTRSQRQHAMSAIKRVCDQLCERWEIEHDDEYVPRLSYYEGTGTMTEFLVFARAPHTHFHEFVSKLLGEIRSLGFDKQYDIRPYTHVLADEMFSDFAEDRPVIRTQGEEALAIDAEEDESLEYKATFALNLRGYIETGKQEADKKVMRAVTKAVCGLLNSPNGGTLMLGVLETRRELDKTKDKLGYLTKLREEFDFEVDPEQLNDPPNALIGIEAEVGKNKIFDDQDAYQRRLAQALGNEIDPNPHPFTTITFTEFDERTICVVSVKPGSQWFYGKDGDEFFVREAGSTRAYKGLEADLFKKANPRG